MHKGKLESESEVSRDELNTLLQELRSCHEERGQCVTRNHEYKICSERHFECLARAVERAGKVKDDRTSHSSSSKTGPETTHTKTVVKTVTSTSVNITIDTHTNTITSTQNPPTSTVACGSKATLNEELEGRKQQEQYNTEIDACEENFSRCMTAESGTWQSCYGP